jgi:hypothetical protein
MKTNFTRIGALAAIIFALTSCYPGGAEYTTDTDIIVTNYNENYDFNSVNTYFLSDSIQHIVEEGTDPSTTFDNFIINEMVRNFNALGWERLDSTSVIEPDVDIVVTVAEVTNYNVYSYPWYPGWGWYWKSSDYWGYPGYGWGYPWYGGSYVTSYSTGTIHWRLFDPDEIDENEETIYVEWEGALNGLLGSSSSSTQDRITRGINQAFTQSPYLK